MANHVVHTTWIPSSVTWIFKKTASLEDSGGVESIGAERRRTLRHLQENNWVLWSTAVDAIEGVRDVGGRKMKE